ncbi:uncharacterized protein L969DRAFT_588754 [Mixia osmundae IAM 14324]|uniref:Replication protein A C-terminal domain-containing protein n=1 Tax=Mixia osmundae (strain CBS 9802 / IAM 14324 / JCM 22182 / KY 12970) TaxID=764103 RepID=G7EA23_MIXOS|nr:uncharacterized protein L969DRAFT_588754 [Mixia osmundae IAM 14324]KEI37584.1 hypothetical protein L969DRAFT_588754 [Mixia osmundae IAM 14324]GAA99683.1 hypothetical protein E5Q_06387 [Mixia osmundae IAM 14324]
MSGAYGGGGGFVNDGSQTSPGGAKKGDGHCTPVTLAMVTSAEQGHAEAPYTYDGVEIGNVEVIALVEDLNAASTNATLSLDDGTGRADARVWLENGAESSYQLEGIEKGTTVHVIGGLKDFNSKRSINIVHVRPVHDPNEEAYHRLRVAHLQLQRKRPTGARTGPGANAYRAAGIIDGDEAAFASLTAKGKKIMLYLKELKDSGAIGGGGVAEEQLARQTGISLQDVKAEAISLSDDGQIFEMDEGFWAPAL